LLTPQILEHHHRIGGLAVADHGRRARAARGIKLGRLWKTLLILGTMTQ
jgi:hypothetical protein